MFKSLVTFLSLFLLSFSLVFGAADPTGPFTPPGRKDTLDFTSQHAKMKLKKAENILSTLISDPQSYQLLLSSNTDFGGEAVAPNLDVKKPSIIVYSGALNGTHSDEELAFMLAHELGHLNLHHQDQMTKKMDKINNGHPMESSGNIVSIYYLKFQEREADLYGLNLYKKAGYDMTFFTRTYDFLKTHPGYDPHTKQVMEKPVVSLSFKNSHFSMFDRFELLATQAGDTA